jgi:hypothetical protein
VFAKRTEKCDHLLALRQELVEELERRAVIARPRGQLFDGIST